MQDSPGRCRDSLNVSLCLTCSQAPCRTMPYGPWPAQVAAQMGHSAALRPGLGPHERWLHPSVPMPASSGFPASARSMSHAASSAPAQSSAAAGRSSISGVLMQTLQQEGVRGIYKGIGPTLAGILPYAGLKFYVYQSLKQSYRSTEGHEAQRLPIAVMLSFGAGAGLVAQTVTYPLDVVRRQMQVGPACSRSLQLQAQAKLGVQCMHGVQLALVSSHCCQLCIALCVCRSTSGLQ